MNRVAEHAATTPTRYCEVGDVRYAYRELRPDNAVDRTPVLFLHRFRGTLTLQLRPAPEVCLLSSGLVGSSPSRPGNHQGRFDPALGKAGGNAADFLQ